MGRSRTHPAFSPGVASYDRVRPLSLFYSDASADGVEERSLVPRSRSHPRLRRNATMSHAFSRSKRAHEPPESRWSPPATDTRNPGGATGVNQIYDKLTVTAIVRVTEGAVVNGRRG
ncbi:hypothetical protein EVAR_103194_1 [Eumeta japonica]|uniref:Uncharacterized protein n=1 Tax=Eumeta variegata TaxID=151549 RepID=A0A4C1YG16_EUMVA|nr:hypothetical protein EVAR_103194_1 [Eumeta japonica]